MFAEQQRCVTTLMYDAEVMLMPISPESNQYQIDAA